MQKRPFLAYPAFILLCEGVGLLASLLSADSRGLYAAVAKPALAPPGALFPIVWTLLYALMGLAAARVWLALSPGRERALLFFGLQLAANFCWSLIFFNVAAFGAAFLWLLLLLILIALMISAFRQVDDLAAWLQLPCLLWVCFAGYLNFMVWRLNP